MNPRVVKLREEREKNVAKIASLQARNKKIDADIIQIENTDILGMVHEFGLSPDALYELIVQPRRTLSRLCRKLKPLKRRKKIVRNNLKRIISLMLVVLCVASFSVTAFAYDGGEVDTSTVADSTIDTETTVTDETEAPATDETEADFEIPFNYTIDNDGNLIITIEGATDPAEITTTGTVVTNGSRLNLRTGAGLDFEIIDQLRPGEEVTISSCSS